MKLAPYTLVALVLLMACREASSVNKSLALADTTAPPPAAGTVMAADSMRITADVLNVSYFSVRVLANEYSSQGTYTIKAAYGFNEAESMMTMPKGGEALRPLLRKGKGPYTYIIYFMWQGKPYDYFLIQAQRGQILMKHTNAYVLSNQ